MHPWECRTCGVVNASEETECKRCRVERGKCVDGGHAGEAGVQGLDRALSIYTCVCMHACLHVRNVHTNMQLHAIIYVCMRAHI